ncbi:type II toxin-antitoxin system MqsA family antitoxin [Pantoea eucrina]|uniref:type II toxin-antitoxin system MqsA family antitoxin n=1 Tax=Pantoea eucrina TaxID=472693 RepID=UPI003A521DB7
MRCSGCHKESFLYGTRDVCMDINDPEKVISAVRGSHCLTCGRVIIDGSETATLDARLQVREVIDA